MEPRLKLIFTKFVCSVTKVPVPARYARNALQLILQCCAYNDRLRSVTSTAPCRMLRRRLSPVRHW